MQRYNWEGTFNTRDLGYTPTATGRYIKRDKYETIENYLLKKGILQTEIEMLKRKLLE